MPEWVINLIGWIPAIIFPGASALQLYELSRSKSSEGVSAIAWILFALANVGAYLYLEKYWAPQALAYILAGLIQIGIAILAIKKRPATQ
jgi:uncharacterized protein with PQ loop repeat